MKTNKLNNKEKSKFSLGLEVRWTFLTLIIGITLGEFGIVPNSYIGFFFLGISWTLISYNYILPFLRRKVK